MLEEAGKAQADAEAGVDGAAARLADLSRRLVETSREAFGTAGAEFASDRANAISAAERVIAIENERIKRAQETAEGTRAAVEQSNVLLNEGNDIAAQMLAAVRALASQSGGLAIEGSIVNRQVSLT